MSAHSNWSHALNGIKTQFARLWIKKTDDGNKNVPDERQKKEYNRKSEQCATYNQEPTDDSEDNHSNDDFTVCTPI